LYNSPKNFDISEYKESIGYKKSRPHIQTNFPNILSQCYSRYKVKNILYDYVQKTGIKYDFVIGTRFDFKLDQFPDLSELNKENIYFTNHHPQRPYIFNDNISISSLEDFFNLFNIYENMLYLANGDFQLKKIWKEDSDYFSINNGVELNIENLNTGNMMYYNIFEKAIKIQSLKMELY
jgi:hypothetical protein